MSGSRSRLPATGRSLAEQRPALAAEWHPTKNGDLTPATVTHQSNRRVWWRCPQKHEWLAIVYNRTRGNGCPICKSRPKAGESLAERYPLLAAEWHPTKNSDLTPHDVAGRASRAVWWRDRHGHEWRTRVLSRAEGTNCPICWTVPQAGKSLAELRPDLASEWHPTKNGNLTPQRVSLRSGRRVWWLDAHGHEWETVVHSRTSGAGCPKCARKTGHTTSKMEHALRLELSRQCAGVHEDGVTLPRTDGKRGGVWQVDVLIDHSKTKGIVIEYDGYTRKHGTPEGDERDARKSNDLREQGYVVVRVRPGSLSLLHEHDVRISNTQNHYSRAAEVAAIVTDHLTALGFPVVGGDA